MRRVFRAAAVPVALASGYITEERRAQGPAAGAVELVYRPNAADDLCTAVARMVPRPNVVD